MSTAPRYIPHYTIEDYRHWEGAWELIDGIPIAMSPSPFGPHERIVTELSRQVSNQLIENKSQCRVYCNLDWIISDDTVVRPDLMVVCGQQPERHLDHAPDLAVEVLSESTRQHDLTVKRALYLENQVAHYSKIVAIILLVNSISRDIILIALVCLRERQSKFDLSRSNLNLR